MEKFRDETIPTGIAEIPVQRKIGKEQLNKLTEILKKYKAGKFSVEQRAIQSEEWWKLNNDRQIAKKGIEQPGQNRRASGWLHSAISNKHADLIEAYPEPNMLPREEMDKQEAQNLSDIVPCILEQNEFEQVYSENMWQKLKCGTGIYKVIWDKSKLNGLGDIAIKRVNLLNIFFEPGITDIQDSRFVFETELIDNETLEGKYPMLKDKLKSDVITVNKFLYDDNVDTSEKSTLIRCYYHTYAGAKKILQYVEYVGDNLIYATENDTKPPMKTMPAVNPETGETVIQQVPGVPMAQRGFYDHGMYPFVFDSFYPVEGSPCGYGLIDLCKDSQEEIDIIGKAIVDNTVVAATPRFLCKTGNGINEEEFMDIRRPIIHYTGNGDGIIPINSTGLSGNYIEFYLNKIEELKQISGNTDPSSGTQSNSVTAASAIAALQEAAGKGSRDSTKTSYRAFNKVVTLVIELIRQFYDAPRSFRITGKYNEPEFLSYTNKGLQPQYQGAINGIDLGYRLPVFDIKVSAQKKNVYTKISQNELALQFFQLGFFSPDLTDQSLMCLDMMDFDGKDEIMQKVAQNGTIYQQMILYQQLALTLAAKYGENGLVQGLAQQVTGHPATPQGAGKADTEMQESDSIKGIKRPEHSVVEKARAQSNNASQPEGGEVIKERDER